MTRLMWWNKQQGSAIEAVRDLAAEDPLVTSFGRGMVVVGMELKPDGYRVTWSLGVAPGRTLPEVERFIAKVAAFIIDEPLE